MILITAAALLSACENVLEGEPVITATTEPVIVEYERPVLHVSRTSSLDCFIPCQVFIDGSPVTVLNAAMTTLQNIATQDIFLPRLAPGAHEIELAYGKARKLYRDAEAACGERVNYSRLRVEVGESPAHVLVFAAAGLDVDRYIFMHDDGMAIEWNTGECLPVSAITVRPDTYTLFSFPSSVRSDGITVSHIGERVSVAVTDTPLGQGVEVRAAGELENGNENSRFTITAGGLDYTIQVGAYLMNTKNTASIRQPNAAK